MEHYSRGSGWTGFLLVCVLGLAIMLVVLSSAASDSLASTDFLNPRTSEAKAEGIQVENEHLRAQYAQERAQGAELFQLYYREEQENHEQELWRQAFWTRIGAAGVLLIALAGCVSGVIWVHGQVQRRAEAQRQRYELVRAQERQKLARWDADQQRIDGGWRARREAEDRKRDVRVGTTQSDSGPPYLELVKGGEHRPSAASGTGA